MAWAEMWEKRQHRWALEEAVDDAILEMNEVSMDPDATLDRWEKAKARVDEAQKALRGSPHTLAGVVTHRTPGRVL